jgi:hypothetical protein
MNKKSVAASLFLSLSFCVAHASPRGDDLYMDKGDNAHVVAVELLFEHALGNGAVNYSENWGALNASVTGSIECWVDHASLSSVCQVSPAGVTFDGVSGKILADFITGAYQGGNQRVSFDDASAFEKYSVEGALSCLVDRWDQNTLCEIKVVP